MIKLSFNVSIMNSEKHLVVTLKHLLINGNRQIGLKFYSNNRIQAIIKTIKSPIEMLNLK